jgi:hypothetical protein
MPAEGESDWSKLRGNVHQRRLKRTASDRFIASVSSAITADDIENAKVRNWKKHFGDLADSTCPGAPLMMKTPPHMLMFALYAIGTLVYTGYSIYWFTQRPEVENFSLMPMDRVPAQRLRLQISCTVPWGCHLNPNPVGRRLAGHIAGPPIITSRFGNGTGCESGSVSTVPTNNPFLLFDGEFDLCFSPVHDDGVTVTTTMACGAQRARPQRAPFPSGRWRWRSSTSPPRAFTATTRASPRCA